MSKTWFITGVSRGFGREFAEAALERGDNVAGTARDMTTVAELDRRFGDCFLALKLDVRDRDADFAAVQEAAAHFGRLDVLVNNAGYGHFGMIEELSEPDVRRQLDTNLLGPLWITQAAMPIMRQQGAGHIVQVSSIGGVTAFPQLGAYHASKFALEGMSQALAAEVAPFGIHVTIIEPGGYKTDFDEASAIRSQELEVYAGLREKLAGSLDDLRGADPRATRSAILKIVDAERPPLRVFFGRDSLSAVAQEYESRLKLWADWNDLSIEADGR